VPAKPGRATRVADDLGECLRAVIIDLTGYQTGFCDRLRQVAFCVALAKLNRSSKLFFKESECEACPFSFLSLCCVDGFELYPWEEELGESSIRFGPHDRPNIATVRAFKPPHVDISDTAFLALWLDCYRLLRLKSSLEPRLESLTVGADCLGLHVRLTDKVTPHPTVARFNIFSSQVARVESVAHRMLRRRMKGQNLTRVFLATDHEAAKQSWTSRLAADGYEVLTNPCRFNETRLRQTSGEDFLLDLFALSKCRTVIGTTDSGVVRTAAWINGHSSLQFAVDEMLDVRCYQLYVALRLLGRHYHQKLRE
jgi:hypothetical protein